MMKQIQVMHTAEACKVKTCYRTPTAECVHGAWHPRDSETELITTGTDCQASTFPLLFCILTLNWVACSLSTPHHVESGWASLGWCLLLTNELLPRTAVAEPHVCAREGQAGRRGCQGCHAADGLRISGERGESHQQGLPRSSRLAAREPMSLVSARAGTALVVFCLYLECWPKPFTGHSQLTNQNGS